MPVADSFTTEQAEKFHAGYMLALTMGHPRLPAYQFAQWFVASDWDDERAAHREWILT
jgi:hypothetical protein